MGRELRATIVALALGTGCAAESSCHDGLSEAQCAALAQTVLPDELPASPSNAFADDYDAALLGFDVFFDRRFSANNNVRCVSCHEVEHGFSDAEAVSVAGLGPGFRNSPTLLNAARYETFLWDGRADSLWSQPHLALEHPDEMGLSRIETAHRVRELYAEAYERVFGPLPDLTDTTRFPPAGSPGDPAFDAMSESDRDAVHRVVANLGKALEAYLRRIAAGPSVVDRYLATQLGLPRSYLAEEEQVELTVLEARGLTVLVTAGCLNCHGGAQLSDGRFRNLGVPAILELDPGRDASVLAALEESPFNVSGPFADGELDRPTDEAVLGGFRTPSLRNLARAAPYGHNGAFATLSEIVDFHLAGGGSDRTTFVGEVDPGLIARTLSEEDRAALVALLEALEGAYPALPFSQWPDGNG